jgi:hypothetical protein
MKEVENLGGTEINVSEALQYLAGETVAKIGQGKYFIDLQDEGEEITVTIDYEANIGRNCVFNEETYQTDSFGKNPFSFEQLSVDLHSQGLEEVDEWLVGILTEKVSI